MPIVTLLTDFGVRDAYVGVVKGVIVGRCPGVEVSVNCGSAAAVLGARVGTQLAVTAAGGRR